MKPPDLVDQNGRPLIKGESSVTLPGPRNRSCRTRGCCIHKGPDQEDGGGHRRDWLRAATPEQPARARGSPVSRRRRNRPTGRWAIYSRAGGAIEVDDKDLAENIASMRKTSGTLKSSRSKSTSSSPRCSVSWLSRRGPTKKLTSQMSSNCVARSPRRTKMALRMQGGSSRKWLTRTTKKLLQEHTQSSISDYLVPILGWLTAILEVHCKEHLPILDWTNLFQGQRILGDLRRSAVL